MIDENFLTSLTVFLQMNAPTLLSLYFILTASPLFQGNHHHTAEGSWISGIRDPQHLPRRRLASSHRRTPRLPPFFSRDGSIRNCTGTTQEEESSASATEEAKHQDQLQLQVLGEREDDRRMRFGGVGRLFRNHAQQQEDSTEDAVLNKLQRSTVIVIGLGGVGSWAAEALCRSGVGHLRLVDFDDICISNTNRQLHALSGTIGQLKIDAMWQRLLQINPNCNVTLLHDFVTSDNVHSILEAHDRSTTVVLDAMDGGKEKAALLSACADLRVPVVTCGGAAGRKDPTSVVCKDLIDVKGDNLLRSVRKDLRKWYGFGRGDASSSSGKKKRRKFKIDCVYSEEMSGANSKSSPKGNSMSGDDSDVATSTLRVCDGAMGTACFTTGTFGFVAAGRVIDKIVSNRMAHPSRGYRRSVNFR